MRRRAFSILIDLAGDFAAPFNLDFTVTNIPGHSPSGPNDQSLSGDQFAVKGALNIGIFSRAFAIEDAPSLMTTFGQSASVASILPWTISRWQEVISPLTDTPGPMIRVRTSTSLSDRGCDPGSWGVEERSAVGGSSVVFQKGSVGFRGFWSACSAGLIVFPSSRAEDPTAEYAIPTFVSPQQEYLSMWDYYSLSLMIS